MLDADTEEDEGRCSGAGPFCWIRATKPAMLSFELGEGCM